MNADGMKRLAIFAAPMLSAILFATPGVAQTPATSITTFSLDPQQRAATLQAIKPGTLTPSPLSGKDRRPLAAAGSATAVQVEGLREGLRTILTKQSNYFRQGALAALTTAVTDTQRAHLQSLNSIHLADGGVEAHFDADNGTVTSLQLPAKLSLGLASGRAEIASKRPAKDVAQQFLGENRALLKLDDPAAEMALLKEEIEPNRRAHVRYQQTYQGVPLYGKQLLVHVDPNRDIYWVQGRYEPTPRNLSVSPSINQEAALVAALKDLHFVPRKMPDSGAELTIYSPTPGVSVLAYKVTVAPAINERWLYFVDAQNSRVIHRFNAIQEIVDDGSSPDLSGTNRNFKVWKTAQGGFFLTDPNTPLPDAGNYDPIAAMQAGNPQGDTFIMDAQNGTSDLFFVKSNSATTWDPTGVSAVDNTRKVYDYYKSTFGRDGIDAKQGTLIAAIHVGQALDNAFWNGQLMAYGDGGKLFKPLAGCLDVAGHEMTHGVTERTAGLLYQNQSGALNESLSDIFGSMVERQNWLLGENCTKVAPGYLRNMENPALGLSPQPTKMSEYRNLPTDKDHDNGGVHVNSGIPNRAAFLIAEGLSKEGLGTSIGRAHTEQIFYRALTTYLTQSSQFLDARRATIQAAKDLFPGDEVAVAKAWDAVEVTDGSNAPPAPPPPSPTDPIAGGDLMIYLSEVDRVIDQSQGLDVFIQRINRPFTGYQSVNDLGPFSLVRAAHTRAAAVTVKEPSGIVDTTILYVGADHDVHFIVVDPTTLAVLNRASVGASTFSSIAVSKDGNKIAFTTTDVTDNFIHVLDIANSANNFDIKVQPEDHQQGDTPLNTVLFADSLAFDYSGQYLVFDALNCSSGQQSSCASGAGFQYWSVGVVNIANRTLLYVIPNQDPLVDAGNPVFATNDRNIIALDIVDRRTTGTTKSRVVAWNLELQKQVTVFDLGTTGIPGGSRPSFWGDDDFITFLRPDGPVGRKAWRVAFDTKTDVPGNNPEQINLQGATIANMHRAGVRTLSGTVTPSATQLDFGASSGKMLAFTLTNGGNNDVAITNVVIDNAAFRTDLTNRTLARGQSVPVNVTFAPGSSAGTQTGKLMVTSDGNPQTISVGLVATGSGSGSGGGGGGGGCVMSDNSAQDIVLLLLLLIGSGALILRRARPRARR